MTYNILKLLKNYSNFKEYEVLSLEIYRDDNIHIEVSYTNYDHGVYLKDELYIFHNKKLIIIDNYKTIMIKADSENKYFFNIDDYVEIKMTKKLKKRLLSKFYNKLPEAIREEEEYND